MCRRLGARHLLPERIDVAPPSAKLRAEAAVKALRRGLLELAVPVDRQWLMDFTSHVTGRPCDDIIVRVGDLVDHPRDKRAADFRAARSVPNLRS